LPIRLLALDLDGTLINDALQVAAKDEEAVKAAVAAGVHVVLATGRMLRSALPYAERLGLHGPMINYQGAVVRDLGTGEVWYRCELTVAMQQRVLAFAEPRDLHVNVYVDEEIYTARARPEADLYAKIALVPYHVVGPLSAWIRAPGTKMVMVELDPERVPLRIAELDAWMAGVATVTRSLQWFVEVVNPEASKSHALAMVAERLHVPRSEVCAIGDNKNDQDMIAWAGLGVAMGTSPPEVKAIARYVTTTPEEAGVADVIERFVLGSESVAPIEASG
jgi:Cof subfamily protein (haloacid dehalogenase superfamily)